jgi:hypothetical protein
VEPAFKVPGQPLNLNAFVDRLIAWLSAALARKKRLPVCGYIMTPAEITNEEAA